MLKVLPYDLPDAAMLRADAATAQVRVFVPDHLMIVVGRGSDLDRELQIENVLGDAVPVRRRETGGCAVVLSPDMAVVSMALPHPAPLSPAPYFRVFTQVLQRSLTHVGITGVKCAGTSDLAIGNRKISGSALYRGRHLVFFHAVINLAGDTRLMERYLRFPPRQPTYRSGRSHRDFVSSLAAEGLSLDISAFAVATETEFRRVVTDFRSQRQAG